MTKAPVNAPVTTRDARYVAAEVFLHRGRPGHELEAKPVVDHCEAAGGERQALAICAGDVLAALFLGHALGGADTPAARSFSITLRLLSF